MRDRGPVLRKNLDVSGAGLRGPEPAAGGRRGGAIGNRLASSAVLLWGTTMLLRVLQLATTAILARILDPADYGLVAIAMVVVGVLNILSNFQFGNAIIKTRELGAAHLDTAFTLNLIRGVLSAAALVALARPVSGYMHEPRLAAILYVLAVPALVGGLHNPFFFLFARDLNFLRESRRDALATVLGSAAGIAAAFLFRSYWALVIGAVTTQLTAPCFSYWRVPGRPRLSLAKSREILGFGSWLVLMNALDFLNWRVDYVLIGQGLGPKALGAYNLGGTLTNTATGDVVSSLGRALFPAFSMLAHDPARLRQGYRQIQSITLTIALPIGFGMSAVAADVVLLLFGGKWGMAIPVVTLLAPMAALQTMIASIEALALSADKGRLLFFRSGAFFVVRVALMFGGFYLGGYVGIIYSRVISGTFFLLYGLALAAAITGGHWYDPIVASWRSFAAVAVMYAGLAWLPFADAWRLGVAGLAAVLGAKILLGAVLYVGVHGALWWACGRPDGAERRLLQQAARLLRKMNFFRRGAVLNRTYFPDRN
jgi:O-antigen/teichoic acid export membrane protein